MTIPITQGTTHELPAGAADWLRHGVPCPAALFVVERMTGVPLLNRHIYPDPAPYPRSAYELYLLELMLDAVPAFRHRLHTEMYGISKEWAAILDNWRALISQMSTEVAAGNQLAPKTCLALTKLVTT